LDPIKTRIDLVLGIVLVVTSASAIVEALLLRFFARRQFDWRSAGASIALLLLNSLMAIIPIAIVMPGGIWLHERHMQDLASLGGWAYVLLFFGLEFTYYWWHRLSHRCRWFWATHAVHHSANDLNITVGFRAGITGRIMGTYVIYTPLAFLGFAPDAVLSALALSIAITFWTHAEWIPRLGIFEGVLNTASAHRVHHASNAEYLDSNFGLTLVIFDRLFGTYRPERSDIKIRYGLVKPLLSNNPFEIAFHQFVPLFRDLRRARSAREVIGYLFAPPEWRPRRDGSVGQPDSETR
jgi:sterol desaturase/sphingolipid hydroxylase (fatty acid hydroxylase superfamily)